MNTPSSVNPMARKACYWNTQGVRHIHGDGKPISIELAEKCFRNSIRYGGIIARYNLVLMINAGCVVDSNNELENHLDYLEKEGYINSENRKLLHYTEQPAGESCLNIDISDIPLFDLLPDDPSTIFSNGVIITLRMRLDSKLRTILKNNNCYDKIDKSKPMTGDLVRVAKDYGLISSYLADELFHFTGYVGSLHSEKYIGVSNSATEDLIRWRNIIEEIK